MTLTMAIMGIKEPLIRVPLWSLYFPLVILPDFFLHMTVIYVIQDRTLAPIKRLLVGECWTNMFAMYLIGLDGAKEHGL